MHLGYSPLSCHILFILSCPAPRDYKRIEWTLQQKFSGIRKEQIHLFPTIQVFKPAWFYQQS